MCRWTIRACCRRFSITGPWPRASHGKWKYVRRVAAAVDAEELEAVAAEALVRSAGRYLAYCQGRGFDPWDADDPSRVNRFFPGYMTRAVQGAIIDHARKQDHVTRQARGRIRQIQAAGDGVSEKELSAATGLSVPQIRDARARDAVKPVSLDDLGEAAGAENILDTAPGAAEQWTVQELLAACVAAFDALPAEQQVVVALHFHRELPLDVVAKELGIPAQQARKLHDAAVCEIHRGLARAAAENGEQG